MWTEMGGSATRSTSTRSGHHGGRGDGVGVDISGGGSDGVGVPIIDDDMS